MEMESDSQCPVLRVAYRVSMEGTPRFFPTLANHLCLPPTVLHAWSVGETEHRIANPPAIAKSTQRMAQRVVFDTQSVKALCGGEERGFDGYKRVNGRKRFLLVDTLGLLLSVKIVPAVMLQE